MTDKLLQDRAIRLFTFLREFSELGSKKIRAVNEYEQVLWLSSIPNEGGNFTFVNENQSDKNNILVSVKKPEVSDFYDLHSKIYSELFTLYQSQQRLGENYEVVLGLGFLSLQTSQGNIIRRHLLVGQTQLSFESGEGRIIVQTAPEGINLSFEKDMFDVLELPYDIPETVLEELIEQLADNITDQELIKKILETWLNIFPYNLGYHEGVLRHPDINELPKITFAPALILRKRTERNFTRAFAEIIKQIRESNHVPEGVCNLVKDPLKDKIAETIEELSEHEKPIYFPLLSNDEQLEIAKQIEHKSTVLVQGPPGTGKSQTIANLICHLLASGNRVLVTSHASRALNVLREKIPLEISSLCVHALSDDSRSLDELEESIEGITKTQNTWNLSYNKQEIEFLEKELKKSWQQEQKLVADLKNVRESETRRFMRKFTNEKNDEIDGNYEGTLKEIALKVKSEAKEFSWLNYSPKENVDFPIKNEEALKLINLLKELPLNNQKKVAYHSLDLKQFPSATDFSKLIREIKEIEEKLKLYTDILNKKECLFLENIIEPERLRIAYLLETVLRKLTSLNRYKFSWVERAVTDILNDDDIKLRELYRLTQKYLSEISADIDFVDKLEITGLQDKDISIILQNATDLYSHLKSGGGFGFWKIKPQIIKDCEYLIKNVRVDGKFCDNVDTLKNLIIYLNIKKDFETLDSEWILYNAGSFKVTFLSVKKIEYERKLEILEECFSLRETFLKINELIQMNPNISIEKWTDLNALSEKVKLFEAINTKTRLTKKEQEFIDILDNIQISAANLPESNNMLEEIIAIIRQRDYLEYAKVLGKIQGTYSFEEKILERDRLLSALKVHIPNLVEELIKDCYNPIWEKRFANFEGAWNWAKTNKWLRNISDLSKDSRLREQLEQTRMQVQLITTKLAAAKAWRHCLTRLTDHEISHLKAWQLAIKGIGRGTGSKVISYRKEARYHLEECRTAIPAWIMPLYRVVETITMKPNIFDVVIVDEASQSGPEALILQYLAKKIIVVGDSKQISPSFIGIRKEEVDLLREKLLYDLPFSDVIGIENSFFDQAFIRYKDQICLREHFRCMPEIIQFSNDLCYQDTPLIPLKQYGQGRISPPVTTRYVAEGEQQGKSPKTTNPAEARAICNFIARCLNNRMYDGKTFGVISLLGDEQGKLINKMLLEKVGSQKMESRALVCGDAYAFQGDERDVIILSLVVAPNDGKILALTTSDFQKRFNVAASRAKDQLVLFHSAQLSDLNPDCFRYKLLKYCQNPKIKSTDAEIEIFDKLKHLASAEMREGVIPPMPFENWFELDIYLEIASKGYRIIPKLNVAGYYVDLVVEGLQGRLAIECYSDSWSGPEEYEKELLKQKQLERSGYIFWRIRSSNYYLDSEAALKPLWELFDTLHIYPQNKLDFFESSDRGFEELLRVN